MAPKTIEQLLFIPEAGLPSNKRRLERLIAAGAYTPPPIMAADGQTDLRIVLRSWNEDAQQLTSVLASLVDESQVEDALPRLEELARRYETHYRTVWRSGVDVANMREILEGHFQQRGDLEHALREMKFQRANVFDRAKSAVRRLNNCDIDLNANFD